MKRKNGVFNETADLIESIDISRTELAEMLGVSRASVNAWVVRNSIPFKYRNRVFVLARRAKASVPAGFLGV